jgi:hypothetical protein
MHMQLLLFNEATCCTQHLPKGCWLVNNVELQWQPAQQKRQQSM